MKQEHCIRYTKEGIYTSHSFDGIKELKSILSKLKGIEVDWKYECNPKPIRIACIEHNDLINF